MFGWFRELLEIKYEFAERKKALAARELEDSKVCQSCEVLKAALNRANQEKDKLLTELLRNDNDEPQSIIKEPTKVNPAQVPWNVRRQMLEHADRIKAQEIRNAKDSETRFKRNLAETEKLEKIYEDKNEAG